MKTIEFKSLQSVNATASAFITSQKKGLETSAALLPSLTYHVMVNGNTTMLNKVLAATQGKQQKYMLLALLECKQFAKSKTANKLGEPQYVKRVGGNRNEEDAAKIAALIPDWRELMQAIEAEAKAKAKATRESKAAEVNAEKVENSDSNVIELPGSNQGIANVKTDIQVLFSRVNDLVKTNKVAQSDRDLAASFVAWFNANMQENAEKATGTHGK